MSLPINDLSSNHIETNPLICSPNQLTGFYMMVTLVVKGLKWKLFIKSILFVIQKISYAKFLALGQENFAVYCLIYKICKSLKMCSKNQK